MMAFSLSRFLKRRKSVTIRPIDPPQWLEGLLYRAAIPFLAHWQKAASQQLLSAYERNMGDGFRDDLSSEIEAIIEELWREAFGLELQVDAAVQTWSDQTGRWHKASWQRNVKAVLDFDVEPLLEELAGNQDVRAQMSWASGLIRDINSDQRKRIESAIWAAYQEKISRGELASRIGIIIGSGRKRAKLIARDQTQKLSGTLDRLRQQEAGIESYVWRTSRDERVRPRHRANEGKVFRWDDPPRSTGHPKTEVNCRCIAMAHIEVD